MNIEEIEASAKRTETAIFLEKTWKNKRRVWNRKKGKLPPLDEDSKNAVAAEREATKRLRKRTPEQWLDSIPEKLDPPGMRRHIVALVWWDFFGGRLYPNRVAQFDEYLEFYRPVKMSRTKLICALHRIGYTPLMSVNRVKE